MREFGITHGYLWFTAPAGERTRSLCCDVEALLPEGWRRAKELATVAATGNPDR